MRKNGISNVLRNCLFCLLCAVIWLPGMSWAQAAAVPAGGKTTQEIDQQAAEITAKMSLENKIGQMMILGIQGPALDETTRQQLQDLHAGGVILYDANMETKAQVRGLNQELQKAYGKNLPLFIGVDEEGGLVSRMKHELTPPLSEEAIGRTGNPLAARESAIQTAKNLKALGFNLNFAPVADVGSGRERSFSKLPIEAADFVDQAAKGYEQEGMLYTLKHFPGIGKGHADTHLDRVVVDASLEKLQAEDILPFQLVLQKHKQNNFFVMVSHVLYPALDADHPASVSRAVQTDLLRGKLGYQGIIATDAMEMGALSRYYSYEEMGIKAIQAGADILMVCHGYDHERVVYNSVLKAVQDGVLPVQRIDESVRRIVAAKMENLLP